MFKKKVKEQKTQSPEDRRRFIRHPICIPLEFERVKMPQRKHKVESVNVSLGGLLFLSRVRIGIGTDITVSLPFKDKIFKVRGRVVRCDKDATARLYHTGISFLKVAEAFKVKLVEQLHFIEEYRCLRSVQLNREVSLPEASREWIKRYSRQFRELYW